MTAGARSSVVKVQVGAIRATVQDKAADGYSRFDKREDEYTKVLLRPGQAA